MTALDRPAQEIVAEDVDFETFLRDYAGQHAEWVNGKVFLMPPSMEDHNLLVQFLGTFFKCYCETTGDGDVRIENFSMKLPAGGPAREPDMLVVIAQNSHRLTPTYVDGPADLVIEIVSEESVGRDRGDKFKEYEAGGVTEYWIADPLRRESQFYVRGEDNRFHQRFPDEQGIYQSVVLPRLRLDVQMLYRTPLPSVREIVALIDALLE